jgi:hypothetical protein
MTHAHYICSLAAKEFVPHFTCANPTVAGRTGGGLDLNIRVHGRERETEAHSLSLHQSSLPSLSGGQGSGIKTEGEDVTPSVLHETEGFFEYQYAEGEGTESLRERLYVLLEGEQGSLAGKITSMLVGALEESELANICRDHSARQSMVAEARAALESKFFELAVSGESSVCI